METLDQKLQENLVSILNYLQSLGSELEGVAREQTPIIIQEFLSWYTFSALFWIGFGVFIWLLGFTVSKFLRASKAEEAVVVGYACLVISTMAAIPVVWANVYDLIKVRVAPRLVLIEKVSDLINGRN